jgi:hypothetical protein
MAACDWWDVLCAILLLAGVGEAGGGPGGRSMSAVRAGYHRSSELVGFMHGGL